MGLVFEIRKEVDLETLLPVRWRNLYPESPVDPASSRSIDLKKGTIHFAAFTDLGIIGCVTLVEEFGHDRELRMRWIGVDAEHRGQGVGFSLVQACLQVAAQNEKGIWCNARLSALSLYRRLGFKEVGLPFDIPGIGQHTVMRSA